MYDPCGSIPTHWISGQCSIYGMGRRTPSVDPGVRHNEARRGANLMREIAWLKEEIRKNETRSRAVSQLLELMDAENFEFSAIYVTKNRVYAVGYATGRIFPYSIYITENGDLIADGA